MSMHDSDDVSSYEDSDDGALQYQMLLEVPEEFICDNFNLTGISKYFINFDETLREVQDYCSECRIADMSFEAQILYGLIHKRYIQSEDGLKQLATNITGNLKYLVCPEFGCNCRLVPQGLTDEPHENPVVGYCVKCNECYSYPPKIQLDGAFFGENLAQLFFLRFQKLEARFKAIKSTEDEYCGRVLFGFRISYNRLLTEKRLREKSNTNVVVEE